jgi:hypothetical protein
VGRVDDNDIGPSRGVARPRSQKEIDLARFMVFHHLRRDWSEVAADTVAAACEAAGGTTHNCTAYEIGLGLLTGGKAPALQEPRNQVCPLCQWAFDRHIDGECPSGAPPKRRARQRKPRWGK